MPKRTTESKLWLTRTFCGYYVLFYSPTGTAPIMLGGRECGDIGIEEVTAFCSEKWHEHTGIRLRKGSKPVRIKLDIKILPEPRAKASKPSRKRKKVAR